MAWKAEIEPHELSAETVGILTDSLTALNRAYLRKHPRTPSLYASGVRYKREPRGQERWQGIPHALRRRFADCEDLACWRAAELQMAGELGARAVNTHKVGVGGAALYHIRVARADGSIEDPSRRLGMGGSF